ncbi:MAG TPA: hypothetical protein VMU83_24095 [Hanamia sp.]|nr:hypothetical protein [Hanamia sp.]
MRVPEVEQGDGFFNRVLIRFISMVSGMRLPDAARIVMYHKKFYGNPMSVWTHAAMRGKSGWTAGERELMAAMTAKWNACPFCIEAHGAIASLELGNSMVNAALEDIDQAGLSEKLKATIVFLKKLILYPDKINIIDIQTVLEKGVTHEELEDAIAVTSLFDIMTRCANAFNFAILTKSDLEKSAKRMLAQGYVFGKKGIPEHPNHSAMAQILRQRIFEGEGITDSSLRKAVGKRAVGGEPIEEPYNEIALLTGEVSYKVTDEMVTNVIKKSGSDKAAFELLISAAVSAGLSRWDKATKILHSVSLTHT